MREASQLLTRSSGTAIRAAIVASLLFKGVVVAAGWSGVLPHYPVTEVARGNLADIDYHDGQRYPVLVRDNSQKDYLDEITTPLTDEAKKAREQTPTHTRPQPE